MSLRRKTFKAVRWTTAGAITKGLLQVGQVAVLARILSHEVYELMAIVMTDVAFDGNQPIASHLFQR